eukprot:TRINITY_DN977_c0_g2_i1.p1 TRINITY_DN977_c0_g2~~TRINITY_DN977_c0_g2_i1.p1  ORF type:complete len:485 (-),score=124.63 TRINITY_DN977_c0_g2_i1:86-1375(-)
MEVAIGRDGKVKRNTRVVGPDFDGIPNISFPKPDQARTIFQMGLEKARGLSDGVIPLIGRGMVTMDTDDVWKIHRRAVNPLFNFVVLKNTIPRMIERIDEFLDELKVEGPDFKHHTSHTFEKITMYLIIDLAFGEGFDAEYLRQKYLILNTYFATSWIGTSLFGDFFFSLPLPVLRRFRKAKADVDNCVKDQIKKRRKQLAETSLTAKEAQSSRDLITLLISSEEHPFTDQDIQNECLTFLFAGQDTTASALGWTMYFLGANPSYQVALRDEANKVFSEHTDVTKVLEHLKMAKAVFKESLRIRPIVGGVIRTAHADVEIDGIFVPKGANLLVAAKTTQLDETIYPDPLTFKPERFLEENPNHHPYSFLAFGGGPRACIGMKFAFQEATLILARMFQKFRIETNIKKDIQSTTVIFKPKDLTIQFIPWE